VTGFLKRAGLAVLLAFAWLSLAWLAMALAEEGDRPAAAARNETAAAAADELEADPARLRALAEQGDPEAQYALAHRYHLGRGVERDMAAALRWYEKAALQGEEAAQLALGDQYRIGLAAPRDPVRAARWYRMAAEQGNAFAQYELGNAYRYGDGVPRSLVQAIRWYVAAAEAGNPGAALALAELEAADATGAEVAAGPDPTADPSEPETVPPGVDVAVARLLARADEQMANLALTVPAGDNAYETYREVLALQPDNQAARDGIERVGARYADLANLAAAKGDLAKARHYAAKAEALAPEHPAVAALAIPEAAKATPAALAAPGAEAPVEAPVEATVGAPAEATVEASEPPAALPVEEGSEVPTAVAPPPATVASAKVEPAPTSAPWVEPIGDSDDLIFRPQAYEGRELVVTGTVARVFGRYLLTSENGQNSLVIDVDGLDPAARAELRDAADRAGFLGQVEARITGRIVRQTPVTFALAARECALETPAPNTPFVTAGAAGEGEPAERARPAAAEAPARVPTCYRDTVWRRLPDGRIQTGVRTRCY